MRRCGASTQHDDIPLPAVSVMAARDMTVVLVALPQMASNPDASPDEISWVATMFTCRQALVIGVSGHLSRLRGRPLVLVVGSVFSSAACGLAQSLTRIVVFRLLRRIFRGLLFPLPQSMQLHAFPATEHSKALST